MDDRDVLLIEEYVSERTRLCDVDECESYARWADDEILTRVMMETMRYYDQDQFIFGTRPEEVILEFIEEMDQYVNDSKGERGRRVFEVARDEAENVLKYVCEKKRRSYEEARHRAYA